jgi:hypothetical protein
MFGIPVLSSLFPDGLISEAAIAREARKLGEHLNRAAANALDQAIVDQAAANHVPRPEEVVETFDRYAAARQHRIEAAAKLTVSGLAMAVRRGDMPEWTAGRPYLEYDARNDAYLVPVEWEEQGQEPQRTATAVLERPAAAPVVLPPNLPPPDYLETAGAIGLDAPKVLSARVHYWLATHGWPLYNYDRVMAYLRQLANQDGAAMKRRDAWVSSAIALRAAGQQALQQGFDEPHEIVPFWAPLRTVDRCGSFMKPAEYRMMGSTQGEVYDRAVPKHALEKVRELEQPENFGPGVLKFAVSDYAAVKPDPFLLCLAEAGRISDDGLDAGRGLRSRRPEARAREGSRARAARELRAWGAEVRRLRLCGREARPLPALSRRRDALRYRRLGRARLVDGARSQSKEGPRGIAPAGPLLCILRSVMPSPEHLPTQYTREAYRDADGETSRPKPGARRSLEIRRKPAMRELGSSHPARVRRSA